MKLLHVIAVILVLYVGGFVLFLATLPVTPTGPVKADGIVALTGGDERLDKAVALLEQGAESVAAFATHAVLSGPAVERISASRLEELVVTNSIPLSQQAAKCPKIRRLSVAPLLARAIQSIHQGGSISTLFIS